MNFLTIPYDAKSSGMGNTGLATSPDVYSHVHNPAKYVFEKQEGGIFTFYSPWLRNTTLKDMGLYALSGYAKIDSVQAISSSFRFFSLGDVAYYDEIGQYSGSFGSHEMAFDMAYSRQLFKNMSGAVAFRYAQSKIASNSSVSQGHQVANVFAADIYFYYLKDLSWNTPSKVSFALAVTNLGTQVSYGLSKSYFLPAQLKLGAGWEVGSIAHKFSVSADVAKYFAPTKTGNGSSSSFMENAALRGGVGLEYNYLDMLKVRTGYTAEDINFGNRQIASFGLGGKYKNIYLDIAYLVPTSFANHPMANTIFISLAIDFP